MLNTLKTGWELEITSKSERGSNDVYKNSAWESESPVTGGRRKIRIIGVRGG